MKSVENGKTQVEVHRKQLLWDLSIQQRYCSRWEEELDTNWRDLPILAQDEAEWKKEKSTYSGHHINLPLTVKLIWSIFNYIAVR